MKRREFVKLYDQYAPRIYRFVCLKVNSPQDSEDLTSEAFFKFWREVANKNNKIDNPRALLYRIASNLVNDFYRKKSRTELIVDPEEDDTLAKAPDKTDLAKGINLDSDITEVKKALTQLKSEYQDVIVWHYLDELSIKEIAQILDKSEGAVRVLAHRALVALKKGLSLRDCP